MESLLKLENVSAGYGRRTVIRNVSAELEPGQILAVAGESGCGKTTLLRTILGQRETGATVTGGHIFLAGRELTREKPRALRRLCGPEMTMIFQNPAMSFNPLRPYGRQFAETLRSHGLYDEERTRRELLNIFDRLALGDGERLLDSRPYELSGGMNQRMAIAMAMALRPRLLLADEPTSALDATVRLQTAQALLALRDECGTAMLLVTHDLALAGKLADKTAVMRQGRLVEYGPTAAVLDRPAHPYTKALTAAMPRLGGSLPRAAADWEAEGPERKPGPWRQIEPGHWAAEEEAP